MNEPTRYGRLRFGLGRGASGSSRAGRRLRGALSALGLALALPTHGEPTPPRDRTALAGLLHYTLAREVRDAALMVADGARQDDATAIREAAEEWFAEQVGLLRQRLEGEFGERARETFESFVQEFLNAESARDPDYLAALATHIGMKPPPADYEALRRWALQRDFAPLLAEGTRLLSELETWAALRRHDPAAPTLDAWLERNTGTPTGRPASATRPRNPLADAEARAAPWNDAAPPPVSALDAFAQRRKERRQQALEQARAGMAQMAAERQAAEQETAARELARAQADAEAMKAQARKLAEAEDEAMKQRENHWTNRLKRLVAGAVGAATGAFTGGIGVEAGRRAASEIFR